MHSKELDGVRFCLSDSTPNCRCMTIIETSRQWHELRTLVLVARDPVEHLRPKGKGISRTSLRRRYSRR